MTEQIEAKTRVPMPESAAESRTAAATRARTVHGLFSEETLIDGEDPAEWADFRRRYFANLQPVGMDEEEVADEIVRLKWHVRRIWAREAGLYTMFENYQPSPEGISQGFFMASAQLSDIKNGNAMESNSRQIVRLSNLCHRTRRELRVKQEQRRRDEEWAEKQEQKRRELREERERELAKQARAEWHGVVEPHLSPSAPKGAFGAAPPPAGEELPTTPPAVPATSPASSGGLDEAQVALVGPEVDEGEGQSEVLTAVKLAPSASKEVAFGDFADRGKKRPQPPPPGSPPAVLNPKKLTEWQEECEELEARDDAIRAVVDRAIRRKGEGSG